MENRKWVFLLIIVPTSILLIYSNAGACDQITASNLGKLYYAVNPLNEVQNPAGVRNFINNNRALLQADSPTIRCARALGRRLVQHGLNAFNQNDYNEAYGSVLSMGGNMEQAQDVATSLSSGSVDAFMVGQELQWIADVVPQRCQWRLDPIYTNRDAVTSYDASNLAAIPANGSFTGFAADYADVSAIDRRVSEIYGFNDV